MRLILNNKRLYILPIYFYAFIKSECFPRALSQKTMDSMQVYMRYDQKIEDIGKQEYQDENVKIYAPSWVNEGLRIISEKINPLQTTLITIMDQRESSKEHKVEFPLQLKDLAILARNEPSNVSGRINLRLYKPLIDSPEIIYSLKDLVRQTITVGLDETVSFGGYPQSSKIREQIAPVILIDMIGLQFQQSYNSGRLVLISQDLPKGVLDDLIYEQLVGERKASYDEALKDNTGRYIKKRGVLFDTKAYELFVANDILLACIALNKFASEPVKLKFLKYGSGFFSGPYTEIIAEHIYKGIEIGLDKFFGNYKNDVISMFEFPFYTKNERILELCRKNNVECKFTFEDALQQSGDLLMATTNCADPHAMPGNEMGYSSVDAAVAENLKSAAFKFNPEINLKMSGHFIDFNQEIRKEETEENIDTEDTNSPCSMTTEDNKEDASCNKEDKPHTFSKI